MTLEKVVDYLNELLKLDKEAIEKLMKFRVNVNDEVADNTNCVCLEDSVGELQVGPLGIVGGLVNEENRKLCYVEDADGAIVEFKILDL